MPTIFSEQEVITFLHFVRETGTFKAINGRVQRNIEVFDRLANLTNERHNNDYYEKKEGHQWRSKWKTLKMRYLDEKLGTKKFGGAKLNWRIYHEMAQTMGDRPCENSVDEELAVEENDRQYKREPTTTSSTNSDSSSSGSIHSQPRTETVLVAKADDDITLPDDDIAQTGSGNFTNELTVTDVTTVSDNISSSSDPSGGPLEQAARSLGYTHVGSSAGVCSQFIILSKQLGGCNSHQVVFFTDHTWSVFIYGRQAVLSCIDSRLSSVDEQIGLLRAVKSATPCVGNGEEQFMSLELRGRKGYKDDRCPIPTVRSEECTILVIVGKRCKKCQIFHACLRAFLCSRRKRKAPDSKTSTSSLDTLSTDELIDMCENLKTLERNLRIQNDYLRKKVEVKRSLEVPDLPNESHDVSSLPPLLQLFVEHQISANSTNGTRMDWHPSIIRWALGLQTTSPAAYRYLASNIFSLPTESFLADYANNSSADASDDNQDIKVQASLILPDSL